LGFLAIDIIIRKIDKVTGLTAAAHESGIVKAKRLDRSDIYSTPIEEIDFDITISLE
jgi:hypothetical protein